jgi:RNase H-like domain found in reverse transcriptase
MAAAGFFLKEAEPGQTAILVYNKELLACVLGIRYFRFMVEGRRFTLYTDHRPLTFALTKAAELHRLSPATSGTSRGRTTYWGTPCPTPSHGGGRPPSPQPAPSWTTGPWQQSRQPASTSLSLQ